MLLRHARKLQIIVIQKKGDETEENATDTRKEILALKNSELVVVSNVLNNNCEQMES